MDYQGYMSLSIELEGSENPIKGNMMPGMSLHGSLQMQAAGSTKLESASEAVVLACGNHPKRQVVGGEAIFLP